jgi:serine/threonine-protein kinase
LETLTESSPASGDWFSIEGEAERDFALGETESYTIKVQVPRTVPAGTYRVRCDAVAEHQPQEVFTIGPTVGLTVAAPSEPRTFPWWIIAVAAGVVVVIGVVLFVVTRGGDDAEAPNMVNIPGAQAIAALNAAGFTTDPAAAVVQPCDAPVTSQDVDGDTVTLTFAACAQLRNVPLFVGRNEDNAFNVANQQGFAIEVVRSGTAAACDSPVVAQAPPPNTRTNVGASVVVVLPAGPEICNKIPPAVGREALFSGLAG